MSKSQKLAFTCDSERISKYIYFHYWQKIQQCTHLFEMDVQQIKVKKKILKEESNSQNVSEQWVYS